MSDTAKSGEGARIEKYSPDQVAHSKSLLGGREPTADELRAHHETPAHGILDDEDA